MVKNALVTQRSIHEFYLKGAKNSFLSLDFMTISKVTFRSNNHYGKKCFSDSTFYSRILIKRGKELFFVVGFYDNKQGDI